MIVHFLFGLFLYIFFVSRETKRKFFYLSTIQGSIQTNEQDAHQPYVL